ncbi:class I SAM-dependent methyltransferase [Pedobacter frigoris]|uniref:class I SAM-dependent methyltransferase n=1 Tax=Pedobacter frigoris TaxID=2571272 RepID=UPI00292CBBE1|nr:class I SAM-dependent methyltransferase [Pedobacter frigoris]
MSIQTDHFYNNFSFLYPMVDVFLKPQKRRLFEEINTLPYGQLLEIGVGNGKHLPLYSIHKITGIDTSSAMLEIATKQKYPNIELLQMNGEQLLFPDQSFDYVILSHVIAVVDDPERLLQEIHRVLKPYGKIFILNHFTPHNWLKYVDQSFQPLSRIFHFKSLFYIDSISSIKKFRLLKETSFGHFSYFKLLIYGKA